MGIDITVAGKKGSCRFNRLQAVKAGLEMKNSEIDIIEQTSLEQLGEQVIELQDEPEYKPKTLGTKPRRDGRARGQSMAAPAIRRTSRPSSSCQVNKISHLLSNKKQPRPVIENTTLDPKKIRAEIPNVTTVATWVKRNFLPTNTKVFIIADGYESIKNALLKRNWVENCHFDSYCFNLKFVIRPRDINADELCEYQIINHFKKASHITTKVGLMKVLKNSIWECSMDPDEFFPKCFDASQEIEYNDFCNYYKLLKTENYLKKFVEYV